MWESNQTKLNIIFKMNLAFCKKVTHIQWAVFIINYVKTTYRAKIVGYAIVFTMGGHIKTTYRANIVGYTIVFTMGGHIKTTYCANIVGYAIVFTMGGLYH